MAITLTDVDGDGADAMGSFDPESIAISADGSMGSATYTNANRWCNHVDSRRRRS